MKNNIKKLDILIEMKESFIDYSMSVIISRALPDVRDGLKPVHRRILYSMYSLGIFPNKQHKKSARIVGDVIGKFHPHGDSSIYDAMVRMAQNFHLKEVLIDGHGNFGSIDGDSAAAMRYTEAKMSKISLEMLKDIEKNTVDFKNNYDDSEREPIVLPSAFPNLLINGTTGIAVGMATNIPSHNLGEIVECVNLLINNSDITINEIIKKVKGPDFPTGGLILDNNYNIKKAYETGKGSIIIRGKVEILKFNNENKILIKELPYMVNKSKLLENIFKLHNEKKIEGIIDLRDESSNKGMRIILELKKKINPYIVLNNLYKMTNLQISYGINMLAIDKGIPKILNLKQILEKFIEHRKEIIIRYTKFDKKIAENKIEILNCLKIALNNIDLIIQIIRSSKSNKEAEKRLMKKFSFTEKQVQIILIMKLKQLTKLEKRKIEEDFIKTNELIKNLKKILNDEKMVINIIEKEMIELKKKYGIKRKTLIIKDDKLEIKEEEDFINNYKIIIILTKNGYIKRILNDNFKIQNSGGNGVKAIDIYENDYVKKIISCFTHDLLLFFSNKGKVYSIKSFKIPNFNRKSKGIPLINLLKLDKNEVIQDFININLKIKENDYLFFVTKKGFVKKMFINIFLKIRCNGLKIITFKENDEISKIILIKKNQFLIIGTYLGYSLSFNENIINNYKTKKSKGVIGIRLRKNDFVIGIAAIKKNEKILVITEKGFGKYTSYLKYKISKNKAGFGSKTIKINNNTGFLVGIFSDLKKDNIILITNKGILIKFNTNKIPINIGKVTSGNHLMKLKINNKIANISII